ncbi:MAG: division/cell wall cluster transcriptional repressor MraZ [Clostridia bacterium]|jgi:MraZ protein|nr:division/cell wall cluster transcriptional repressor MraZ [Clostridia bacterium]
MLLGEFRHSLDAKNRLFIPSKHREELIGGNGNFVVVKSIRESCLQVYSEEEWAEYIAPIQKMERKASEFALRALTKDAAQVSPDAQGRIVLTPALVKHAGITKGAVIVGCGKYAEIWAEEAYDVMISEENLDDVKALLESYGL